MSELGRLSRVTEIRTIWPHEERDFSQWLTKPENLSILSEALGFGAGALELSDREVRVGRFRADLLCRLGGVGLVVLIENQFGPTNHDHLGKITTYASGLGAKIVIWIAERFREEHRAALDWLNDISDADHAFFGVEIELWRIGESPPAPRFNVVSNPNEWSRAIASRARNSDKGGELSERRQTLLAYWEGFAEVLRARDSVVRSRKAFPDSWHEFAIGRTGFALQAFANIDLREVRAEFFIYDIKETAFQAKEIFDQLKAEATEIEKIVCDRDEAVEWNRLKSKKGAQVRITLADADPANESDWPRQHNWLADRLERLHRAFAPRAKALILPLPKKDAP